MGAPQARPHDDGASAVEYGLIVVAIAAVIVAIVALLGGRVKATFTDTCDAWNDGAAVTVDCG